MQNEDIEKAIKKLPQLIRDYIVTLKEKKEALKKKNEKLLIENCSLESLVAEFKEQAKYTRQAMGQQLNKAKSNAT